MKILDLTTIINRVLLIVSIHLPIQEFEEYGLAIFP